ncbi:hypothetical protein [Ewingella americana]
MDWLDVKIKTARPTQFQHVQSALEASGAGKLHVSPISPSSGGVTDKFVVRVTERLANNYAELSKTLTEFAARYSLSQPPEIAAIEVTCDLSHIGEKEDREAATCAMTYRLQTSLQTSLLADDEDKSRQHPRRFDPIAGKYRRLDKDKELLLDPRFSYRIGNDWDDVSWRVYWKRTDNKQQLPPNEWRARVEVTLQGEALRDVGLVKLTDINQYQFTSFARFFRFRTPIAPETQAKGDRFKHTAIMINRLLKNATPARGLHSYRLLGRRDKLRRLRRESSHLQADNELQDAIKGALRRLKV